MDFIRRSDVFDSVIALEMSSLMCATNNSEKKIVTLKNRLTLYILMLAHLTFKTFPIDFLQAYTCLVKRLIQHNLQTTSFCLE